jgi:hypothetical protein
MEVGVLERHLVKLLSKKGRLTASKVGSVCVSRSKLGRLMLRRCTELPQPS